MLRMIPVWKIRRELGRIGMKIYNLPATLVSLPTRLSEPKRRAQYDRDFDRLTRVTLGAQVAKGRIAIFLIYQPLGVPPSILETCRWLVSKGYAPLIVSNGPLENAARNTLAAESWRLLERPNFGYDFGGYRDGVRLLCRWNIAPERLIIMNDSVWMPMVPNLMEQIEQSSADVDIYGLLHDTKIIDNRKGDKPGKRPYSYVESYFYLLRQNTWANPAFQGFWRGYQMSNDKLHTVKFGEIGFSRTMAAAGLTLGGLCRRDLFLARLREKDDAFLQLTLKYAAYVDADLIRSARLLDIRDPNAPGWRKEVFEHVERTVRRRRFHSSFPFAHDHIFGSGFMKKNSEPIWSEMRRTYLRALADGMVAEPPAVIRSELEASVRSNH